MKKISLLALVILFASCDKKTTLISLSATEIDTTSFDKYDSKFEKSDDYEAYKFGKGSTWKTWRSLHKHCMESDWFKSPYYFGVSSTINLGAIVDKDFGLQRLMNSTNGFSENDLLQIVNLGEFSTCNYSQELNMSMSVFFQTEFDFQNTGNTDLDAQLKFAISRNKSISVKIDSWRINNIQEKNLIDVLHDAPDTDVKKKRFLETLQKEGNKILVKVVEVKGFTCKITLQTDMSTELEAKLKEGVVAGMGNTGMDAKFKYIDKKTIEVKSGGNFYVFGEFKKAQLVEN